MDGKRYVPHHHLKKNIFFIDLFRLFSEFKPFIMVNYYETGHSFFNNVHSSEIIYIFDVERYSSTHTF